MRAVLESTKVSEGAMNSIENFHQDDVKEVEQAIKDHQYVIVGMKQNPVVTSARKFLTEKNITYKYIEHGSYFSKWKQRLAIKLWSGWPTFPMVFIDGKLIGGCKELKTQMEKN